LGSVFNGSNETETEVKKLSMTLRDKTEKAPFVYTECDVAGAKYEDDNQVWTFKANEDAAAIVYLDGTVTKKDEENNVEAKGPTLKYEPLANFDTNKKTYTPIAVTYEDGRLVQLINGDIWLDGDLFKQKELHPFEIYDAGENILKIGVGRLFSYPNSGGWMDTSGNSIMFDSSVPSMGGTYLKEDNNSIYDSGLPSEFDVFLKFKRQLDEPDVYTSWAQTDEDYQGIDGPPPPPDEGEEPTPNPQEGYNGWSCRLCFGTMGTPLLYGNYNISILDPPQPTQDKPYKQLTVPPPANEQTFSVEIPVDDGPPQQLNIVQVMDHNALKYYSYGEQYYLIARVKKTQKTVNVVGADGTVSEVIQSVFTAEQNLRSDFFFYPPLDNGVVMPDHKIISFSKGTVLPPTEGGDEEPDAPPDTP